MYHLEADTKVVSMRQLYVVEHTTLTSKQFNASTWCQGLFQKVRACVRFFRKRVKKGQKNVKKGQKRAKYMKIWAKINKI